MRFQYSWRSLTHARHGVGLLSFLPALLSGRGRRGRQVCSARESRAREWSVGRGVPSPLPNWGRIWGGATSPHQKTLEILLVRWCLWSVLEGF